MTVTNNYYYLFHLIITVTNHNLKTDASDLLVYDLTIPVICILKIKIYNSCND